MYIGERKHWQKKAQSLSKDMQKMLNVGADVAQLREENGRLIFRIEVRVAIFTDCIFIIFFSIGINCGKNSFP